MGFLKTAGTVMKWMLNNIAKPIFGYVTLYYLFLWVLFITLIIVVIVLGVKYYKLRDEKQKLKNTLDCTVETLKVTDDALTNSKLIIEKQAIELNNGKIELNASEDKIKELSKEVEDLKIKNQYLEEEIATKQNKKNLLMMWL